MNPSLHAIGKVGVVIPFFQREPGVLAGAVVSALAQTIDDLVVIVVDDGSPISARSELRESGCADRVILIEQKNSGPAAARNKGLDNLPEDINVVAFLDSDDKWVPEHIENALRSLALGADLFFSDYIRAGSTHSCFERCDLQPHLHPVIDDVRGLFRYGGDLFDAVLRRSPIGTSTVVYRRERFAALRFPEDLRVWEDITFWLALARHSGWSAFSAKREAWYGVGVNISTADWGTLRTLNRIFHEAKMHRSAAATYSLNASQQTWSASWQHQLRRDFSQNLLHLVRHRQSVDWRNVLEFIRVEPRLILDIVSATTIGLRRLFNRNSNEIN